MMLANRQYSVSLLVNAIRTLTFQCTLAKTASNSVYILTACS